MNRSDNRPNKIDNLVTRKIAQRNFWNKVTDYLPMIEVFQRGISTAYSVQARLPEEYKKWIAHIASKQDFRTAVERKIARLFSSFQFQKQSYLKLIWKQKGLFFETDGSAVYIFFQDEGVIYTYRDIENQEQAEILFLALSVYLPRLYFELEKWEASFREAKNPPQIAEIVQEIKLNKV